MGHFLKCDAPGCDHRETVDEIAEKYIGKKCPACGSSLLTQEDFDHWTQHVAPGVRAMVALGLIAEAKGDEKDRLVWINAHDGELIVKAKKAG